MTWTNYFIGFLMVVIATYGWAQLNTYWVTIEFSFFLIFFIVRDGSLQKALIQTFLLSLGLDFIFQTGQIKGLGAMPQLLMVYMLIYARRFVIPDYSDIFLAGSFGIFFLGNHYLTSGMSNLLGQYYQPIQFFNLVFLAVFHTVFFALLLVGILRFNRRGS